MKIKMGRICLSPTGSNNDICGDPASFIGQLIMDGKPVDLYVCERHRWQIRWTAIPQSTIDIRSKLLKPVQPRHGSLN